VAIAALLVGGACGTSGRPSTNSYAFSTKCALPDPTASVNSTIGKARPGITQTEALKRLVANSSIFAGHKPVAARLVMVTSPLRKTPTLEYEFVFNGLPQRPMTNGGESNLTLPPVADGVVTYFAANRQTFAPDETIMSCPRGST
jgi:hypothetical protein